jgi:hypothetical protein
MSWIAMMPYTKTITTKNSKPSEDPPHIRVGCQQATKYGIALRGLCVGPPSGYHLLGFRTARKLRAKINALVHV